MTWAACGRGYNYLTSTSLYSLSLHSSCISAARLHSLEFWTNLYTGITSGIHESKKTSWCNNVNKIFSCENKRWDGATRPKHGVRPNMNLVFSADLGLALSLHRSLELEQVRSWIRRQATKSGHYLVKRLHVLWSNFTKLTLFWVICKNNNK